MDDVREPPKFVQHKKRSKTKIFFSDLMVIVAIFTMLILFHEYTHATIFRSYGCTNIRHGFEPVAFYTTANCPDNSSSLATGINEIVGYNVAPFLGIMIFLLYKKD
jgi:hypothetical protein